MYLIKFFFLSRRQKYALYFMFGWKSWKKQQLIFFPSFESILWRIKGTMNLNMFWSYVSIIYSNEWIHKWLLLVERCVSTKFSDISCLCDQSMIHVAYVLSVIGLTIQGFLQYDACGPLCLLSIFLFLLCVMSIWCQLIHNLV